MAKKDMEPMYNSRRTNYILKKDHDCPVMQEVKEDCKIVKRVLRIQFTMLSIYHAFNLPCFRLEAHFHAINRTCPVHYFCVVNPLDAFPPPTATVNNRGFASCTAPDWSAPLVGVTSSYGNA